MKKLILFLIVSISCASINLSAQTVTGFRLANIFGDDMVIQRDVNFPVWGFATPGTQVKVRFNNTEANTTTSADGKWMVKLPPMKAGGPHELKVTANNTILLKNVMVGEVWLASGQSNMEFTMSKTLTAKEDLAKANYPDIRFFTVPFDVSMSPVNDIKPNTWKVANPANAVYFSAVAYHFAKELHQKLKVPVGVIHSSKGGTPAEAWTSAEVLVQMPEFKDKMVALRKDPSGWNAKAAEIQRQQNERSKIVRAAAEGVRLGVNTLAYNDEQWMQKEYPLDMPKVGKSGYWGFIWYRKVIDVDKIQLANNLQVNLPLAGQDYLVYFNGSQIAKGSNMASSFSIPKELLQEGKNLLAIRILSYYGKAQVGKNNVTASISSADKKVNILLDGDWKFNLNIEPKIAGSNNYPKAPSVLYNAMIEPLVPFAIKGVIWYQGEANTVNPKLYQTLFPAMIKNWRTAWGQGDFPFAFVQLAGYSRPEGEDFRWALLRETQSETLNTPNTMMATAIDIGEEKDIHPRNKKDVGERLALSVLNKVYNEKVVYSGPVFKNYKIQGSKAIVEFTEIGGGLVSKDSKPISAFELAGQDKVFYQADAEIINNTIVLKSSKVLAPVAVRYAFKSFPLVNLYNKEGLPALPFRTDKWEK